MRRSKTVSLHRGWKAAGVLLFLIGSLSILTYVHAGRLTAPLRAAALVPRKALATAFVVTSTADGGPGTLRQALTDAQNSDSISFDATVFPPGNPATIAVTSSPLPEINQGQLTIDGGGGVILDGSGLGAPSGAAGLVISSNNNSISGLRILNFLGTGLDIRGGNANIVAGNTIADNGGAGIELHLAAANNTIGGVNATPAGNCTGDCNLIHGNGWDGIAIRDLDTDSNTVSGNYIGVDITGRVAIGNGSSDDGVGIRAGPTYNTIGGNTPGKRNVISGHGDNGVKIEDANHNVIIGNFVGADTTGATALPNREDGIAVRGSAAFNRIGGNLAGEGNLVSGNLESGIDLRGDSKNTTVAGNQIGVFLGAGEMPQVFPADMAVSPQYATDCTLMVATITSGVHKSADCGATWIATNNGLIDSDFKSVEIPADAPNANTAYALSHNRRLYETADGGANWHLKGVLNEIGVRNLALSAKFSTDQTMYVAADWAGDYYGGAGVFKSTDGGATWKRMSNGMTNDRLRKVIPSPDPVKKNTLFVLTENGIEMSTDGAQNWSQVTQPPGQPDELTDLALSPTYASDMTLFVTARDNLVYTSTNGGQSWTSAFTLRDDPRYLAISPAFSTDNTLCHGGGWNDFVYCSTDKGSTWVERQTHLPSHVDDGATGVLFSPNYAVDKSIFVASQAGMVKSTDRGHNWQLLRGLRNMGNRTGIYVGDNANSNTLGPGNLLSNNHRGIDFGGGNDPANNTVHGNKIGTDATGMVALSNSGTGIVMHSGYDNTIGPDNVISGNQSHGIGMWSEHPESIIIRQNTIGTNINGDQAIGNRDNGIHINGASEISILDNLISGNGSNGIDFCCGNEAYDNSIQGNKIGTDAGGAEALPNREHGIRLGNGAHDNKIGGAASGEGNLISGNGDSGVEIWDANTYNNVIIGNELGVYRGEMRQAFPSDIAISPKYAQDCTLMVATVTNGVHRSRDCGETWSEVNSGLNDVDLRSIEIPQDASSANRAYLLGSSGRVYTTSNGGDSWQLAGSMEDADLRNLALSATASADRTLYVAVKWWADDRYAGTGVFKSTNDGSTWSRMVNGMSDVRVEQVIPSPDPAAKQTLFALTESTIERSTDGGKNWSAVTRPDGQLTDLALSPTYADDQTLFVAAMDNRVYTSTDGGQSWSEAFTPRGDPRHLAVSPAFETDRTVCHGGGWNNSSYCSTDGGRTWSETRTGLPGSLDESATGMLFSPNYASDETLFMASRAGVVKSMDRGFNWTYLRGLRHMGNRSGVTVREGAHHNTIGPNNVISNNHRGVDFDDRDPEQNSIVGNKIGTDKAGATARPNSGTGIVMHSGHDNVIGGPNKADGNIIGGNVSNGIGMWSSAPYLITIQNNQIGADRDGVNALGNRDDGLRLNGAYNITVLTNVINGNGGRGISLREGARDNQIGGAAPAARNLISGNRHQGVDLSDDNTVRNVIEGNYIGTNWDGIAANGNGNDGVYIGHGAWDNRITGNLISGNDRVGVSINGRDSSTRGNEIADNIIGLDASGNKALGNGVMEDYTAVEIYYSPDNRIVDNIISGNTGNGVTINGDTATGNVLLGNHIGTNVAGSKAIGNGHRGVQIQEGANNNTVGGSSVGDRNVVSGNAEQGVLIEGPTTANNRVIGNYVGTDASGLVDMGNGDHGVDLDAHDTRVIGNVISGNARNGVDIWGRDAANNIVEDNIVGLSADGLKKLPNMWAGVGLGSGARGNRVGPNNTIAHNDGAGVYVGWQDEAAIENTITRNSIYGNNDGGIALRYGGNLEFFAPILTDVGNKSVSGQASPQSTVEIFSDDGEQGRTHEGSTTARADGTFTYAQLARFARPNVTATATDADGNTSEFSGAYDPLVDVAVVVLFKPGTSMIISDTILPSVKVSNPGTSVAEKISVELKITGPEGGQFTVNYSDVKIVQGLNSLAYRVVSFKPFTPTLPGQYTFVATASSAGDMDPTNDVLTNKVVAKDGRIDVWTKDNPSDTGEVPTSDWWQSPDLWVRNQDDGKTNIGHQDPISGTVNYVYVRVRNRGSLAATNTKVKVYWHEPSLGIACGEWALIGERTVATLAPGNTEIISVPWTPTRTGHTCLFDVLESTQDPVTQECDVAWDNNIEQRNVEIIPATLIRGAGLLASDAIEFDVTNVYSQAKLIDVVIDRSAIAVEGSAELDLGDALFQRWESMHAGTPLTGAKVKGATTILVTDAKQATVHGLPLSALESLPLTLTVITPSDRSAEISVYGVIDDNVIGGNTYTFVTESKGGSTYLPLVAR